MTSKSRSFPQGKAPYTYRVTWSNGNPPSTVAVSGGTVNNYSESISSANGRQFINPCNHTIVSTDYTEVNYGALTLNGQPTAFTSLVLQPGLIDSAFDISGIPLMSASLIGDPDFGTIFERILFDASGQTAAGTNLPVFLLEMSSLKGLFTNSLSVIKSLLSGGISQHLSLKQIANRHLEYKFGVLPLISDIKAILNMSQVIQARVSALKRRSGVTSRLSRNVPFHPSAVSGVATGSTSLWETVVKHSASANLGCYAYAEYPNSSALVSSLQYLGITNPAIVAWELVPFSFIVDWFFDVSSKLESTLDVLKGIQGNNISLTRWSHSIKTELSVDLLHRDQSGHDQQRVPKSYGKRTYSTYIRKPGIPASLTTPVIRGFSINHTLLGLSLVAQRRG